MISSPPPRPIPAERMSVMAFDHLEQFRRRASSLLQINRDLLNAFLDSRQRSGMLSPARRHCSFPAAHARRSRRNFSIYYEKNTKPPLCLENSLRCHSISASASVARPPNLAGVSNVSMPRSMSSLDENYLRHASFASLFGGIAQLVERLVRNEKVWGSNPHTSTNPS